MPESRELLEKDIVYVTSESAIKSTNETYWIVQAILIVARTILVASERLSIAIVKKVL